MMFLGFVAVQLRLTVLKGEMSLPEYAVGVTAVVIMGSA